MSVDKNKAIIDFLITCPQIYESPLYFNFVNANDSDKQIVTMASDRYTNKPYIDGSVNKQYSLTILDFRSISDMAVVKMSGYDSENVIDLSDVQALIDWISEQNELKNFPNFGEDCIIEQMYTTTEEPKFEGINDELSPPLAMYSITIRIEYTDVSKVLWR